MLSQLLGVLLLGALFAVSQQRIPPQLPLTFQADVIADLPFFGKVKGREYYDFTKQFDRLDFKVFGTEQRSYAFYDNQVQFNIDVASKKCQKKDLEGHLYPFYIAPEPMSQYVGEEVISGVNCEHWKIDLLGQASVDLWATNQTTEGKTIAVLKKAVYTALFMTLTTEFSNIVVGPLDPSVYDISQFPACSPPPPPVTYSVRGFLKNAVNNRLITETQPTVTLRNLESGQQTLVTWPAGGLFQATGLVAGEYILSATASGYLPANKSITVTTSIPEGTLADVFMSPKLPAGTWRAVLSWAAAPRDLDLHMVTASSCHVYYRSKTCGDAQLDYDVTAGYGPETITFTPKTGTYYLYVNNYSGEASFVNSRAAVKLYNDSGIVKEVVVPTSGYDSTFRYWKVLSVTVSESDTTINVINSVSKQP